MEYRYLEKNSVVKKCKVGFSWTLLFFGIFPLFFRGMYKDIVILLLLQLGLVPIIILSLELLPLLGGLAGLLPLLGWLAGIHITPFLGVLGILPQWYYALRGNTLYIEKLLIEGYSDAPQEQYA